MTTGADLEDIIAHGNRGHLRLRHPDSVIQCPDGFSVSVVAGGGTYCAPRPVLCACGLYEDGAHELSRLPGEVAHDYPGPYTDVEVGFPSERPEPWDEWKDYCEDPDCPTGTVYAYVPVRMVRDLVALHG